MDLIARISELFDELGWSKYQLAKEAGLSQSPVLSIMKRGNNPTVSTIERCCAVFGISVAELFNDDLRDTGFSLEERKLISDWRNLSPEMKKAVVNMVEYTLDTDVAKFVQFCKAMQSADSDVPLVA